jgi:hypothetical protein
VHLNQQYSLYAKSHQVHPSKLSCFEIEDERYGLPMFAALATESDEAVQAFFETQMEIQPLISPFYDLCKQYCQDKNKRANLRRDFTFSRQRSALSCITEHGDEILLTFLLETKHPMPDNKDKNSRTPLPYAASGGHVAVVQLLLEHKVDANSKDN